MSGVDVQDLNTVVIGKRGHKGSGGSSGGSAGGRKQPGVVGIGGKLESGTARKLDDNEAKAPDTIGLKVGQAIMAARSAKQLDQVALANQLAMTRTVIVQLEQGVHKKDNKLLQRLEKKLGVWLTGDSERIGQPKAEKEKKGAAPAKIVAKKKKIDASKAVEDETKSEVEAEEITVQTKANVSIDGEADRFKDTDTAVASTE